MFPEEDFPLYCPKCDYLLRGLENDRCPECGREFERGRLLVEQYVLEGGRRLSKQTARYAKWTFIVGLLFSGAAFTAHAGLLWYVSSCVDTGKLSISELDSMMGLMRAAKVPLLVVAAIAAVLVFASVALSAHLGILTKKKRAMVFESIDRDTPSFQAAQRLKPVLLSICAIATIAAVAFEVWSTDDWLGYWTRVPSRIVTALGIPVGIGIALYVGGRLWRRWRPTSGEK